MEGEPYISGGSTMNRDKVRAMFVGTAIGDGLGMPVETMKPEQIRAKYPNGIRGYERPDGHKWFDGNKAGTWTDDTQLTVAVADGLILAKDFNLDAQAGSHVEMLHEVLRTHGPSQGGSGVPGWGKTTADAIRRMSNGVSWKNAADRTDPNAGHGNGVVMRLAPIAAWFLSPKVKPYGMLVNQRITDFSAMTHFTKKSAVAAVVHVHVLAEALCKTPDTYQPDLDISKIVSSAQEWLHDAEPATCWYYTLAYLNGSESEMFDALNRLRVGMSDEQIHEEFGGGSCNVTHSLPFTYAHWMNGYKSIQLLYSIVEAGGDTDSNASIAGGMLGALHGMKVFPDHLLLGLDQVEDILSIADEFCETFGIA